MTTQIIGGAVGQVTTFKPLGYALPVPTGLALLHLPTSLNELSSGTQMANLAYAGAPASTIVGSPTITTSGFTVNVGNRDYLQASSAIVDIGGDMTFYFVFKNLDTLASATTSPVLFSNYGNQTGAGPEPAGVAGLQIRLMSTTTLEFDDYMVETSQSAPVPKTNSCTDANLNNGWRFIAGTVTTATVNSVSTLTWTYYDMTGGTTQVFTSTAATGRAANAAIAWRLLTSSNGVRYGMVSCNFMAVAQTAVGGGGAHTAAQIALNYKAVQALMAALPIPATC